VRGRAFGFFITCAGLVGNLSHWLAGHWVKGLGTNAHLASAYYPLYRSLALLLLLSLTGLLCLHAIRNRKKLAPEFRPTAAAAPGRNPKFEAPTSGRAEGLQP